MMKRLISSVAASLLLFSCSAAPALAGDPEPFNSPRSYEEFQKEKRHDNWKKVRSFEIAWQGGHAVDALQTGQCSRLAHCFETNSWLGRQPSDTDIAVWWAATGAVHYLIAKKASEIEPWAGYVFVGVTSFIKFRRIHKNAKIVGITIPW